MEERDYKVGTLDADWADGPVQNLTFIVTEDCNLRCKYCYITHKSKGKVLKLETAKKFIDYILTNNQINRCDTVILDFIGGEPLLEVELIDKICDYFKVRAYEEGIPWYWKYQISIGTNGVNYSDESVQRLIQKNEGKISIGITIDGTKEKHDLQRVFPDGSGSYEVIHDNMKLWMSQFPASTKVTFASEDLKYLKKSIIHLWNEGITSVAANVVYEDVWKTGDDLIFEKQLKELADYIIDNDLYDKYYCTLFLEHVGAPLEQEDLENTSCGAGKMLALGPDGNIYPCMRYYDYSLNKQQGYIIGNVDDGIDMDKARVFVLTSYKYQCDDECLKCPIAKGCEFCQGHSYDESESGTNFQKAKYICKMHKARVRANNYYFAKLYHKTGISRQNFHWKKTLYFILSSDYLSDCSYYNKGKRMEKMSAEMIRAGLEYAEKNFFRPVFLYGTKSRKIEEYEEYDILHRIPIESYKFYENKLKNVNYQIIVTPSKIHFLDDIKKQDNIIFNIRQEELGELGNLITLLLDKVDRINVNIQNLSREFSLGEYEKQLEYCVEKLVELYYVTGSLKEINIITDLLFIKKHEMCDKGEDSVAIAPDGKLYICPAFYSENLFPIGDIEAGMTIKNENLYTYKYMPLCQSCDAYQCENCKWLNYKNTKEVNISPQFQCMKAQIERKASYNLQNKLKDEVNFCNLLENKKIADPITNVKKDDQFIGYYMV